MAHYGLDEAAWRALEREVVDLFTALLRVDTINGNETACATILRDYLADNGIDGVMLGELPDRQNLVARLEGARPGPTLTLMGHLDVVPADAAEWSVPPFGGVVKDGYVWGCGATDMKNQVAAEAVALARLKRSGADFAGDDQVRRHGGRGGRRVLRRPLAVPRAPRPAALRLSRQRGHGRPVAAGRRPQGLPAGRRREGLRAVPHPHARPRRARVGAREGAQRGHRPGARRRRPGPRRPAGHRLADDGVVHRRPGRGRRPAGAPQGPATARAAGAELRAADPEVASLVEPLLGATLHADHARRPARR